MKRTPSKAPKKGTQHPSADPSSADAVTPPKRSVEDVNNQLYQEAAQRILQAIEAGTSIWQKPWIAPSSHRRPFNAHTGLNYLGMNRVLLMTEMMANGWTDTRFMTYKQVQALAQDMKRSGTPDDELPYVKKGAQSITIYKVGRQEIKRPRVDSSGKPVLDQAGQPIVDKALGRTFLQTYRVFNANNIANLPPLPEVERKPTWEVHAEIEALVKKLGVPVTYEPIGQAFYQPGLDRITVPERSQYKDSVKDGVVVYSAAAKHYSVLLHECCHATGHESRLNRVMLGAMGSPERAREELTAETASAFLMASYNMESDEVINQHASYLEGWAKLIKDDPRALFQAFSAAEKAADWFMQRHERQLAEAPQVSPQPAPSLVQGVGVPQQQVDGIGQGLVAVAQMPSSAIRINGLRPAGELLDAAVACLNSGSMGPT